MDEFRDVEHKSADDSENNTQTKPDHQRPSVIGKNTSINLSFSTCGHSFSELLLTNCWADVSCVDFMS